MNPTQEVQAVQQKVMECVFRKQGDPKPLSSVPAVAKVMGVHRPETVRAVFGEFGESFFQFFSSVDPSHPDLPLLVTEEESNLLCEALAVCDYANTNKLNVVLGVFSKLIRKNNYDLYHRVGDPFRNLQFVRMLGSREERDKVRRSKTVRDINIRSLLKEGEAVWRDLPAGFMSHVRLNNAREEQIQEAERRLETYRKLRSETLQNEVKVFIDVLKKRSSDEFMGFHSVSMADASLLLSKLHGGKVMASAYSDGYIVVLSQGQLGDWRFDVDGRNEFQYGPRAYPFGELAHLASKRTLSIIDHLEAFPEMSGKPIFDHYIAVVPSVEYKRRYLRMPDGNNKEFSHETEAAKALDNELIKRKSISPVLIGERDGKCYFIGYFEAE